MCPLNYLCSSKIKLILVRSFSYILILILIVNPHFKTDIQRTILLGKHAPGNIYIFHSWWVCIQDLAAVDQELIKKKKLKESEYFK